MKVINLNCDKDATMEVIFAVMNTTYAVVRNPNP